MTVIGAILTVVGALHLALLPFVQARRAMPAITLAMAGAEQRIRSAEDALNAARAVLEATARFRGAMGAAPDRLHAAIADLVARGRAAAGPRADPYKAVIRIRREGATSGDSSDVHDVLVEEAIRRQIGRHVDALSLLLDGALEPLRASKQPPHEAEDAYRAGQALGGEVAGLNHILREAFAADPSFWARLEGQGSRFGAVSARAGDASRRIEDGLRALDEKLAAASAAWKSQQQEDRTAIETLRARQADLSELLTEFRRRLGWIPLNLEDALRLYPLVAGALAVIALFLLRQALRAQRARAADDHAARARSWAGSPASKDRWSILLLAALPLIATIHAAIAAITARGLYTSAPADPGATLILIYGTAYAALILMGLGLLLGIAGALAAVPPRPLTAAGLEAKT